MYHPAADDRATRVGAGAGKQRCVCRGLDEAIGACENCADDATQQPDRAEVGHGVAATHGA